MRLRVRPILIPTAVAALLMAACAPGHEPSPTPAEAVTDPERTAIEVAVDDELASATASIAQAGDGTLDHTVEVTWHGDAPVTLDDARFTHHQVGEPGGDLVLAGRGCGADWDAETEEVIHICTMDLQIIELAPGEAHAYPVRIHPEVGPLRLRPGTYRVQETVGWRQDGERGSFTISLTYEVQ
jgi:hypothetical protein